MLLACGNDSTSSSLGGDKSSVDSVDSNGSSTDNQTGDSTSTDNSTGDTSSNDSADSGETNDKNPDGGSDENDDPQVKKFKVYLEYNGSSFVNESETPITVVWSDGLSYEEAEANERGIATIEGLDGNYFVTLKNIPDGYTYNPNPYNMETDTYGYEVSNDNSETTIELYKIGTTKGAGSTEYNRTVMTRTGVYRATLTGNEHKILSE